MPLAGYDRSAVTFRSAMIIITIVIVIVIIITCRYYQKKETNPIRNSHPHHIFISASDYLSFHQLETISNQFLGDKDNDESIVENTDFSEQILSNFKKKY